MKKVVICLFIIHQLGAYEGERTSLGDKEKEAKLNQIVKEIFDLQIDIENVTNQIHGGLSQEDQDRFNKNYELSVTNTPTKKRCKCCSCTIF